MTSVSLINILSHAGFLEISVIIIVSSLLLEPIKFSSDVLLSCFRLDDVEDALSDISSTGVLDNAGKLFADISAFKGSSSKTLFSNN